MIRSSARALLPRWWLAAVLLAASPGACQLLLDPAIYRVRDAAAGDAQGMQDVPAMAEGSAGDVIDRDEAGPRLDAPGGDSRDEGVVSVDVPVRFDVGAPDSISLRDVFSSDDALVRPDAVTTTDVASSTDASGASDARPDVASDVACGGSCATAQTCCGGACVDTQTSVDHCGGCNMPCPAGATCSGGACVCGGGHVLCLISSRQRCCDALCTLILCL